MKACHDAAGFEHPSGMFQIEPIGYVRGSRTTTEDDNWGNTSATIELAEPYPSESLAGLEAFSHAEIVYVFDRVKPENIVAGARHPRSNTAWPRVGIFAQRAKMRPNRLGVSIVRILSVEGRTLRVAELDAMEGTPVVDIKPVMNEFLPRTAVTQPAWATELMSSYWNK
jgi:tRNA (adenine37-N6)-methyltransferase